MKFTKEGDEEEMRINMDPMLDCVFLLIIFFLVTTSFIKLEQDLSINLPIMSKLKVKEPPTKPIVVNVRNLPGGKAYYHVNNERIEPAVLAVNMSRARLRNPDQAVIIRGDRNVKWDHIAKVMGCAAQAGITKVSASVEVSE